jgi:hypothetical protein
MPGAYGFQLVGAAGAAAQLVEGDPDWPTLEIGRHVEVARLRQSVLGADRAEIVLLGGDQLTMERIPLRATFATAQPLSDDALVHPYLAPAAAIAGYWLGREALHAGAFTVDDGVWAVLGAKESGKSSLLAALSQQGVHVVSDDLVMLADDVVFAGPRSIDLREEPARKLKAGEAIGVLGERERWRLRLPAIANAGRMRGWVLLSWGDSLQLTSASPGGRLQQLLAHRMIQGLPPPDPRLLLELAALPALHLSRPRSWSLVKTVSTRLIEGVSARSL